MTDDELRLLALRAIADIDARIVLADWLQESGWYDDRIVTVVLLPIEPLRRRVTRREREERRGLKTRLRTEGRAAFAALVAEKTSESLARAVAAVLLFGDWRTRPWLVWYRHRRDGTSARLANEKAHRELGLALAASITHREG